MGSAESHFNVSSVVKGKVTPAEEKIEPTLHSCWRERRAKVGNWTNAIPTSLTFLRQARSAHISEFTGILSLYAELKAMTVVAVCSPLPFHLQTHQIRVLFSCIIDCEEEKVMTLKLSL